MCPVLPNTAVNRVERSMPSTRLSRKATVRMVAAGSRAGRRLAMGARDRAAAGAAVLWARCISHRMIPASGAPVQVAMHPSPLCLLECPHVRLDAAQAQQADQAGGQDYGREEDA